MNVSIQTAMGLRVYRELVENELSAPAKWEMNYGVHNQLKPIDRQKLLRVDGLEAAKSLPMPLAVQLFHLQRERIQAIRDSKEWEANALPKFSRHPISKTAVDIFGEKTAHAQRPNAEKRDRPVSAPVTYSQGPPHSRGKANVTAPIRLRNKWSIDHEYFDRERVGAAHMKHSMKKAWA